jgi:integrase
MKTSFKATSVQFLYRREPIGIYYARLYQGGKTKWVSLETRVFGVAKAGLAKRLQTHYAVADAEHAVKQGRVTIGELSKIYLRSVELDGAIKDSSKLYRTKTIKYLFRSWPELGTKAPARVSETECLEWAARYREAFSQSLYNNTLGSLRAIFDLAISKGLIARNSANEVERVRVTAKKLDLPTGEQFKALVESIRTNGSGQANGCADLVEFLAYSGLRITEAGLVRWQDVEEERGRIYVAPGKNSQSRHVPLLPAMKDLLDRIRQEPRWFPIKAREKSGYIISVVQCRTALTGACKRTKAHRITHHDLRHLFATKCIESGVDIPTVSRWLGHRDGGALCMKVYGHLRDAHSQEMAAKVSF